MNEAHDHSSVLPGYRQAIYNPGRLTDAEVKASFIVRQHLLEAILEDVAGTKPGAIPQHHLLIGQRGMGKTLLLRRLDVALREAPLAPHYIPLSFPEEQYTVDRLSKFWLNCLDAMADTVEREGGSPEVIAGIDAAVDRLRAEAREDLLAEAAEKQLLELAAGLGRRPVLLVDNLDFVFERLKIHEQSRLRAFLMRPGAPILVGACVSPPPQTVDYGAPFYDHFKTHFLERLSLEEMREVLLRLAQQSDNQEILSRLDAERPRLRALHTLTGGNPRTTAILFHIFAKGFSQEAYQDLEALLDWITPSYKARFEEFSAQAQVVVSSLAANWEPATIARLAALTSLENHQLSPQLDRLRKAGVVEEVTVDPEDRQGPIPEKPSPKDRTGYQLAERFFNIWFLMRQATRRDRRALSFLTRFIECIHTPSERSTMARELLEKRGLSRAERIYGLALESAISEPALRYELHDHVHQEMVEAFRSLHEKIDELIDPSEIPPHRFAFAELRDKLKAAVTPGSGVDPDQFADAILGSPALMNRRDVIATQALDKTKIKELLESAGKESGLLKRKLGKDAANWFQRLLRRGTLTDFADPIQVGEAYRRADTREKALACTQYATSEAKQDVSPDIWDIVRRLMQPDPATCQSSDWARWGEHAKEFQRYGDAEAAFRKAIELDPNEASTWDSLGDIFEELHRYNEAEAAYRKALEINSEFKWAWHDLGWLYAEHLHRYPEAESAYRKAIEIDPEMDLAWHGLGMLYGDHLHRYSKAESAYLKAIEIDPKCLWGWIGLGDLYSDHLQRFPEAESAYRKAIEINPKSALAWFDLGTFYRDHSSRFSEAEAAFRKAVEIEPKRAIIWGELGISLTDCPGQHEEALRACKRAVQLDSAISVWVGLHLIFVLRDYLRRLEDARQLLGKLPEFEDRNLNASKLLHHALFSAYDENWGLAIEHLGKALDLIAECKGFPTDTRGHWMRASAVLLHLGFGAKLLEFLQARGEDLRLRPWHEAIRAHLRGDRRYLRNIPLEMQEVAGVLYDGIGRYLGNLPESTRRWAPPLGKPSPKVAPFQGRRGI